MQSGFEGFLECAIENDFIVATQNKSFPNSVAINGLLWNLFLKKFNRDALWIPNPLKLLKLIKKNKIKNVHVVGEPTYLSLLILSHLNLFFKLKLNLSCRTAQNIPYNLPYFPFKYNFKILNKQNLLVFGVSPISVEFAKNFYNQDNVLSLSNGVPESFYDKPINYINERKYISYIGTFLERKGFIDFIECAKKMFNRTSYEFIMVGADDTSYKKYRNLNYVNVIKKVNRDDLIEFLDHTAVLVVPSKVTSGEDFKGVGKVFSVPWMEQFGRIIIEAYSRGVEVVAYDSGAIKHVIRDKSFLVKEGQVDLLAKKILFTASHFNSNNINETQEYSQNFKWKNVFNQFLNLREDFFSQD